MSPERSEDILLGRSIGNYRIVREIGRGGMGTVYEAVHDAIGQRAAVKVLGAEMSRNEKLVGRFFVEARAISMVKHPGLVSLFDFSRMPDGTVYILMEYLEGDSLWQRYQRLRRKGERLGIPDALQIVRQIASTLAAVHRKGIVHRDLKPENVILVEDPDTPLGERAKLLDFGIAKLREEGAAAAGPEAVRSAAPPPAWSWARRSTCRRSSTAATSWTARRTCTRWG